MKNSNPKYQEVLFIDTSNGEKFICGTTLQPTEKEVFEGKEYPVIKVAVSSASHPFFKGGRMFIDTEGRVEKFTKRYQNKRQKTLEAKEKQEAAKLVKKKKKSSKK